MLLQVWRGMRPQHFAHALPPVASARQQDVAQDSCLQDLPSFPLLCQLDDGNDRDYVANFPLLGSENATYLLALHLRQGGFGLG